MLKKPEPKGINYSRARLGSPIKTNEITIRRLQIDGELRDCYVFKHNGTRYVQVVDDRRIGLSKEIAEKIKKGKVRRIHKCIDQYTQEELEKMKKEELVAILNRELPTENYVLQDKRKEMIKRILELGIQRRRRNQMKQLSKEELERFIKFKGIGWVLGKQHGYTTKKHYLDLLASSETLRTDYFKFRQAQLRAKNIPEDYKFLIWMLSDGSVMTQKQIESRFGYEVFKHAYNRGYLAYKIQNKTFTYSLGEDGKKLFYANPKAFENLKTPALAKPMAKGLPANLMESFKELASNSREYSIGLDFERELRNPQQIVAIQGAKDFTFHIGKDFEMFGHTHPNRSHPEPSTNDLLNLQYGRPEFIVAGKKRGNIKSKFKAIIMNLEDEQKYREWKKDPKALIRFDLGYKRDRDRFFEETGVRIYPYRKGMKVQLIDDPKLEKGFPFFQEEALEKISTGRLD